MRDTYSADLVVFLIISRLLNSITTNHSCVAVVVVGCVGGEVHLAEEFRLMVLEFTDHVYVCVYALRLVLNINLKLKSRMLCDRKVVPECPSLS